MLRHRPQHLHDKENQLANRPVINRGPLGGGDAGPTKNNIAAGPSQLAKAKVAATGKNGTTGNGENLVKKTVKPALGARGAAGKDKGKGKEGQVAGGTPRFSMRTSYNT